MTDDKPDPLDQWAVCCCDSHHPNYGCCLQCPRHGTPPPADKPDIDAIVREACKALDKLVMPRRVWPEVWTEIGGVIRAALEQAQIHVNEDEVQARVKHATTVAQGEALARAAVEAERDTARAVVMDICKEWHEDCEPCCDSFGHDEKCKAVFIAAAKRALRDRAEKAEADAERLAQLLRYIKTNRYRCFIPSYEGDWDERVDAALAAHEEASHER